MKRLIVVAVAVLLFLGGCTLFQGPTLVVKTDPQAGHPPFAIAINAACSETGGTYTLTEPGKSPVESSSGLFATVVTTYPYKGTITWTDGKQTISEPVRIGLINKSPVAHDLFLSPDSLQKGEKITIDLRYLAHGCHNGTPIRYTGIEDPDYTQDGYSPQNDHFKYYVEVFDDQGNQETVFKPDGMALSKNEYIRSPIFTWFVGWQKKEAPYPFSPQCVGSSSWPKYIHVFVEEWGDRYHWVYTVEPKH